jgi:endonuclease/exonuclease/phosphatase family metal-dependent hydrolase
MGGEARTEASRTRSAEQLADFYHRNAETETTAMLAAGDFNCEPSDRPFKPQGGSLLRAVRERQLVLRTNKKFAYLYNIMWRHMGEADHYDRSCQAGYRPPRLLGSFCDWTRGIEWKMFDQVLVSKEMLTGGPIRLVESSVKIIPPHRGCSDHCVLRWELDVA